MKIRNGIMIMGCFLLLSGCSDLELQTETSLIAKAANMPKTAKNGEKISPSSTSPLDLKSVYFNNLKVVNGRNVIQNPTNVLALVNKYYFLPNTYIPSDLIRPNVEFSFKETNLEKAYMRKEAATALENMFVSAKDDGIELFAASGYRSYSRQRNLFEAEINHVGKENAEQAVAFPGSSEHQTGLAMDIAGKSTNLKLTEKFANTKEGKWLVENAHHFGFILRYPKGKEGLTHYEFEPWHYRYVGINAATVMYQHNWTLEEYFQEVKKI